MNGGAPPAGSANGAGKSRPQSKLADDDLAALREALAAIADAGRILAQARSLGS